MRKLLFRAAISVVLLAVANVSSQAITPGEDDYRFDVERRVNAHGDEFMALDQTSDGRFLIVGTESDKLLIWSITERRIVKQFDQGSAVHCVVTAWEVFQLGATLVELDLNKKIFDELYSVTGYLHAMDVREPLNLIATAGDDKFVRVRKLSDLSLVKEFKAEPGVPQGVALMDDGRHVVFSASSAENATRISVGDLSSGRSRTLFDVPEPFVGVHAAAGGFVYKRKNTLVLAKWSDGATVREYAIEGELDGFAVSANGEWLVAANNTGSLFRFEIRKGTRSPVGAENIKNLTGFTISSDGRYVYTTEF